LKSAQNEEPVHEQNAW